MVSGIRFYFNDIRGINYCEKFYNIHVDFIDFFINLINEYNIEIEIQKNIIEYNIKYINLLIKTPLTPKEAITIRNIYDYSYKQKNRQYYCYIDYDDIVYLSAHDKRTIENIIKNNFIKR